MTLTKTSAPNASATKTAGASVELRGLRKHYGNSVALAGINLHVRAGEFMTFLGPSGSGKTTTLNAVAGFTVPTSGSVYVDFRDMEHVAAHKRGLGVVFQHYALFPHMTVSQNVEYPLRRRGIAKGRRGALVHDALDSVRLDNIGDRYPSQLSGGQQQRVALARSLVFRPSVLLMDEPLGALDKRLRGELQLEFKRIHRDAGSTFIYVTHDQEEALVLSDRIAVFNQGRIEQVGTGSELYERPHTLFVGTFIGDSTILRGPSSSDRSGTWMTVAGHRVRVPERLADAAAPVILLRPEHTALAMSEEAIPPGSNVIPVTVVEAIYLGSCWLYEVRLTDGSTGKVRSATLVAERPDIGSSAWMHWRPEQGVLLPDEDRAASDGSAAVES